MKAIQKYFKIFIIFVCVFLLFLLILNNSKPPRIVAAKVLTTDLIEIFQDSSENKDIYAETSAVIYDGKRLIVLNDSPLSSEGCSAAFSIDWHSGEKLSDETITYFTNEEFLEAKKYEAISITPDKKYIIATTAFDRIKPNSCDWNPYNTILIWKNGLPSSVKIVLPFSDGKYTSSLSLRDKIAGVLKNSEFPKGPSYFKIEGLAVIPGNKLLFGVREIGKTYKEFEYVIKIICVSYQIKDGNLVFKDDFKLVYDCNVKKLNLGHILGISSIEYNPYAKSLLLLTSFEEEKEDNGIVDKKMGGFLWEIPLEYLNTNKPPILINKENGDLLLFTNKPEGISLLDKNHAIIFYDNDEVLKSKGLPERRNNQALYSILKLTYNKR